MKISIIGAGNVGATCADIIAQKNLVDTIILLDIKPNLAEGKAMDISQNATIFGYHTKIIGVTAQYSQTKNSDIIIITSGTIRKVGMSREDILIYNAKIVKAVATEIIKYSPYAKFIVVSNPVDIMTYIVYKTININSKYVIGMSGILDTARYNRLIANKLVCSIRDIQSLVIGAHGDTMLPLTRYTNISGIPITELLTQSELNQIIEKTKKGGEEIIKLLGISAWYAPGAAIAKMIEIMMKNPKTIISCSTLLQGEYGIKDIYIGMPVILNKEGINKIIELKLNQEEMNKLNTSVIQIKNTLIKLNTII